MAVIFILYAFAAVFICYQTGTCRFLVGSYVNQGVPDMQAAYAAIFGQGMWIIAGSVVAFLIGQLVDVFLSQNKGDHRRKANLAAGYRFNCHFAGV